MPRVRRGCIREVRANCLQEIRCPPVVQEEYSLSHSPERGSTELLWSRLNLNDVIREVRSHIMEHKIRKQGDRPVLKNRAEHHRSSLHLRCVAERAANAFEDNTAPLSASARMRIRGWPIGESHQELKLIPVRQDVQRVIESKVTRVIARGANYIVGLRFFGALTPGIFFCRCRERLIGYSHLNVICLSSEDRYRFVLALPPESSDGAVIPASIWVPFDSNESALRGSSIMVRKD